MFENNYWEQFSLNKYIENNNVKYCVVNCEEVMVVLDIKELLREKIEHLAVSRTDMYNMKFKIYPEFDKKFLSDTPKYPMSPTKYEKEYEVEVKHLIPKKGNKNNNFLNFVIKHCEILGRSILLDEDYVIKGSIICPMFWEDNTCHLNLVGEALHFELSEKINNINPWVIEIRNSIESKIKNTTISLPKKLLLKSRILKEGITFKRKNTIITIWQDKKKIIVTIDPKCLIVGEEKGLDIKGALTPYVIPINILPDKITNKSLEKLLINNIEIAKKEESKYYNETDDANFCKNLFSMYNLICIQCEETKGGIIDNTSKETRYEFDPILFEAILTGLKLIMAYSSPELRGSLKKVRVKNSKSLKNNISNKMNYRKWVWGTDKTEYIYPQSNNNKSRKRYYCRPALSKYYITNLKKYSDYDIINEPERTYYYRHSIIKWRAGHWKGNEEKHYYAGNISGPYSRKAISWLNRISKEKNIEIDHAEHNKEFRISLEDGKYYLVDGYCKENNTVYEFHGDFWHGNPNIYNSDDINPRNKKTYGELYKMTIAKEQIIKSIGFNLVIIWESDFDKMVRK